MSMATRRSARLQLQKQAAAAPTVSPRAPAQAAPTQSKKRKPPASGTSVLIQSRSKAAKQSPGTSPSSADDPLSDTPDDALSSLPPEIFELILDAIQDDVSWRKGDNLPRPASSDHDQADQDPLQEKGAAAMSRLARTSKRFQRLLGPRMHKRITLGVGYHAHIPYLIRTLDPYLKIAQRKQLKREGKYKGQQDRFSSRLDPDAVPACGQYVRQLLIGSIVPGNKHKYICLRYIEEMLKNIKNLEFVDTRVLTESMAESIASMESLKALRLDAAELWPVSAEPLMKVKNLKHLCVMGNPVAAARLLTRSVLLNSTSTLQSLQVRADPFRYNFLEDWADLIRDRPEIAERKHSLVALKSLHLASIAFDETFIRSIGIAIDFTQLRELHLDILSRRQDMLWEHLIEVFSSAKRAGEPIHLKTLRIEVPSMGWDRSVADVQRWFGLQCRFLATFDTLTSLEIQDFTYSKQEIAADANPDLPEELLQGFLAHKDLVNLNLSYRGYGTDTVIPTMSVSTTTAIIDALPHLRNFEFALSRDIEAVGRALARGANLERIKFHLCSSFERDRNEGVDSISAVKSLLSSFLARGHGSDQDSSAFVWEEHYKLRHLAVEFQTWEVASKFDGQGKGMETEEKMVTSKKGGSERQVRYRDVSRVMRLARRAEQRAYSPWAEKMDKTL